jgi:hypothetical protein
MLARGLARQGNNSVQLALLGWSLADVARHLEPAEGARRCAGAAEILARALATTNDPWSLSYLALSLAEVAGRLGPEEAARTTDALLRAIARMDQPPAMKALVDGLSAAAAWAEPGDAARVAGALAQLMARNHYPPADAWLAENLATVLAGKDEPQAQRRSAAVLAACMSAPAAPGHPIAGVATLAAGHARPPCRFSTPELVELLKQPASIGHTGRIILDRLEDRYGRRFADHWAFVRFAQAQGLDLDFSSPPKRLALSAGGGKQ